MESRHREARRAQSAALTLLIALATSANAQNVADAISIPAVVIPSDTGIVRVPVYLRDEPGTLLGLDQPAGRQITVIAFKVTYGPRSCIDSADPIFDTRNGVLEGAHVFFSTTPMQPHTSVAVVYFLRESTPIPRRQGVDELLGELVFSLDACGSDPIYLQIARETATLSSLVSSMDGRGLEETAELGTLIIS